MFKLKSLYYYIKIGIKKRLFKYGFTTKFDSLKSDISKNKEIFNNKVSHEIFITEIEKGKNVIMVNGYPKLKGGRYLA